MITAVNRIDIDRLGALVLQDQFAVTDPTNLTSAERQTAYEVMKNRVRQAARSEEEYQRNIKLVVEYLEI